MPITVSDFIRFVSRAVLNDELQADAVVRMPDELVVTSLSIAADGASLYVSDDPDEDGDED